MKIELDYDTKTVTIIGSPKISEVFEKIKLAIPDLEDWKLEQRTEYLYHPYSPYFRQDIWKDDTKPDYSLVQCQAKN